MSETPDTQSSASRRARVAPAEPGNGWVKPKHGKGMLRPFPPGSPGHIGKPSRYTETQQLARAHSLEALRALIERLRDPDGRIVVVAANSILERAWGKVREQKPEEHAQQAIDLSTLSAAELDLLMKLVDSGRLKSLPEPEPPPQEIEGKAEPSD